MDSPENTRGYRDLHEHLAELERRGLLLNLVGVPLLTAGAWLIIRPLLGIP